MKNKILNKNKLLILPIISLVTLSLLIPNAMAYDTLYDLTWTGTIISTPIGGAIWEHFPSTDASGTGVFDTYLALQRPGGTTREYGLNHNGTVDFNKQIQKLQLCY